MGATSKLYAFDPLKYAPFVIDFMQQTHDIAHNGCKSDTDEMNKIAQNVCNDMGDDPGCDWNVLNDCITNDMNQVYHEMGLLEYQGTNGLNWVPWIVLNNQHSQQEEQSCENNILNCTCSA